ncbi:hypothetical protein YYC_05390 [Plasmodium yoelii 17X]|uniref:Uncharacterized protein n=1 Tax=Plasmodium yoelii 17X TaxID=1323249 RepID=V7PAV3_PLAYE|nr:hypothetical protein YYC_05390 [Plasmodium yoelii 17X]
MLSLTSQTILKVFFKLTSKVCTYVYFPSNWLNKQINKPSHVLFLSYSYIYNILPFLYTLKYTFLIINEKKKKKKKKKVKTTIMSFYRILWQFFEYDNYIKICFENLKDIKLN